MTRAKFKCVSVTKSKHWDKTKADFLYTAKFNAVYNDSPENQAFFDATPSGTIELGTYKEDVFVVGSDYFVDFSVVETK